jgi:DNA invertase Pin-like site-specific DNA recombinase
MTASEVQEHAIRAWARQHGHKIAAWHRDEGLSGADGLESRTGLADAIRDLRDGRATGVVFYRLDRLARDVILQETLLRDFRYAWLGSVQPVRRRTGQPDR